VATLKKTTKNWIASAKYDIESARHMFATRRYIHVILYELIRLTGLSVPEQHQPFIAKLNQLSIATRYPEDLDQLVKSYPKSVARDFLKQSRAILKWLEQDPKLKK
jgi:HEPN domain-containing protein